MEKMEVIDTYTLKILDLFIDHIDIEAEKTENSDSVDEADGSIDDLGETPTEKESIVTVEDLANLIDSNFPEIEVLITSDSTLEMPTIEKLVEFLKSIEPKLDNFDIEITDKKIFVKGK
jgi:hypothetical protein